MNVSLKQLNAVPEHVAIIMDGNRRWASQRGMPAAVGHASGAKRVREIVEQCADRGVRHLTVFAFSTENWQRPADEVSSLMKLMALYLRKEIEQMHARGVRFKLVGDITRFDSNLQKLFTYAETLTAQNTRITFNVAANYGGRWDMLQAVKAWQVANPAESTEALTEDALRPWLKTAHSPDPSLLIRTGGELRISNFMLWQTAYTELFFTDTLWPSFTPALLEEAFDWYASRDRRFGSSACKVAV
jgi:undecaprenyl diphosphate synthase